MAVCKASAKATCDLSAEGGSPKPGLGEFGDAVQTGFASWGIAHFLQASWWEAYARIGDQGYLGIFGELQRLRGLSAHVLVT